MELNLSTFLWTIGIIVVVWYWYNRKRNEKLYRNIPGPPTVPFLGNALDFSETADILDTFMRYTKTYGGIVKGQIGPFAKFLLISDYDILEFILGGSDILKKSEDYDYLKSWLGDGLLISSGPIWKKHRKILPPAFHVKILEQFVEVFETNGDKLITKLEQELSSSSFDVHNYVSLCSLDIICESIMGTNVYAQDDVVSDYVQKVHLMCKILTERAISFFQSNRFLYLFTKNYQREREALKILHSRSLNVINQRRKVLGELSSTLNRNDASTNSKEKKPFLDLLLQSEVDGKPLSEQEIREEVDTFMFAGHDTTSSAISFALYCLANNADVQKQAFDEQVTVLKGTLDQPVTCSDLQNMKYLEMVIKETLRLYPSVPFIGRESKKDIKCGDITLPADVGLVLFIFGIHRNPKYFENPDIFNPDRFATVDSSLPYAYIPFSAGPRNCIGQKFAMLEMKSLISKILRKYELLPAIPTHSLKLISETVLKSNSGIKIRLKQRTL